MVQKKLESISHYAVIIIAILAFVVSVQQNQMLQNHNKLSVRPLLNADIIQNDSMMEVRLVNRGVGPAINKRVEFTHKGETYTNLEKLLVDSGLAKNRVGSFSLNKNSVIAANGERLLVKLKGRELKEVKVRLHYESIYEEPFEIDFSF